MVHHAPNVASPAFQRPRSEVTWRSSHTVDDVQGGKSVEDAQQVIANRLNQSCIGLESGTTGMGCEDYILQLPKRRVRRQRLGRIYIQSRASEMARQQSLDQSLPVHDRTGRRAD